MKAREKWEKISGLLVKVIDYLKRDDKLSVYEKHFDKIENSHYRNKFIYDMCLSVIGYDNAAGDAGRKKYLRKIEYYNEKDFEVVKKMCFDVNPVEKTGNKSCMYSYHWIKRVLHNIGHPDDKDEDIIYLGVEAMGWLWLK